MYKLTPAELRTSIVLVVANAGLLSIVNIGL